MKGNGSSTPYPYGMGCVNVKTHLPIKNTTCHDVSIISLQCRHRSTDTIQKKTQPTVEETHNKVTAPSWPPISKLLKHAPDCMHLYSLLVVRPLGVAKKAQSDSLIR